MTRPDIINLLVGLIAIALSVFNLTFVASLVREIRKNDNR